MNIPKKCDFARYIPVQKNRFFKTWDTEEHLEHKKSPRFFQIQYTPLKANKTNPLKKFMNLKIHIPHQLGNKKEKFSLLLKTEKIPEPGQRARKILLP